MDTQQIEKITDLKMKVNNLQRDLKDATRDNSKKEEEISELQKDKEILENKLEAKKHELQELKSEKAGSKSEKDEPGTEKGTSPEKDTSHDPGKESADDKEQPTDESKSSTDEDSESTESEDKEDKDEKESETEVKTNPEDYGYTCQKLKKQLNGQGRKVRCSDDSLKTIFKWACEICAANGFDYVPQPFPLEKHDYETLDYGDIQDRIDPLPGEDGKRRIKFGPFILERKYDIDNDELPAMDDGHIVVYPYDPKDIKAVHGEFEVTEDKDKKEDKEQEEEKDKEQD